MQHCLNKLELDLLVDNNWILSGEDVPDDLVNLLDQCRSWETELVCFSYFISQLLERKAKSGANCQVILRQTYEFSSEMWLSIQQFDSKFIKYIFRYVRNKNRDLDDELIEAQVKLGQHIYG